MFRFILWVLLIYFGWRILKTFITIKSRTSKPEQDLPHINTLEEAEYQDITHEPENPPPSGSESSKESPPAP